MLFNFKRVTPLFFFFKLYYNYIVIFMENNIDDIIKNIKKSFKSDNGKGLLLNDYEVEVLTRYGFDYKKYASLNELIFEIDNYINEEGCFNDVDELEEVLEKLSEEHYYSETNK